MRIAVFDARPYDREALATANHGRGHVLAFTEDRLGPRTAAFAADADAAAAFVNDDMGAETLAALAGHGVRTLLLRCAGFDRVDLAAAARLGVRVMRVPAYSPHAVAEHAVALLLGLNRKLHRAYVRGREGNFALDGLVGFDLAGKTVAVLGTGAIGRVFAGIMRGFGCRVLAWDAAPDEAWGWEAGVSYAPLDQALAAADVVSLHVPLTPETRHLLDADAFAGMKRGVIVINTGRGGLIDTAALVDALRSGQVGGAGLDVYEHEAGTFFADHSARGLDDDLLQRLLNFPNVLVTGHQAYLTREALAAIAATTLANAEDAGAGRASANDVTAALAAPPRP